MTAPLTLFITATSPYVRQCRIVVREKRLLTQIREHPIGPVPPEDAAYLQANPAGHGPALVTPDATLIGAPAICAYLDAQGDPPSLACADWRARARHALADAAIEFAVRLRETRSEAMHAALTRTLDQLERDPPPDNTLDMAAIATAVAMRYLEFRHPTHDWRDGRPSLASLSGQLEQRDSFQFTAPPR